MCQPVTCHSKKLKLRVADDSAELVRHQEHVLTYGLEEDRWQTLNRD